MSTANAALTTLRGVNRTDVKTLGDRCGAPVGRRGRRGRAGATQGEPRANRCAHTKRDGGACARGDWGPQPTLRRFGSMAALFGASEEELALCPGLGPTKVKRLFAACVEGGRVECTPDGGASQSWSNSMWGPQPHPRSQPFPPHACRFSEPFRSEPGTAQTSQWHQRQGAGATQRHGVAPSAGSGPPREPNPDQVPKPGGRPEAGPGPSGEAQVPGPARGEAPTPGPARGNTQSPVEFDDYDDLEDDFL